MSPYANKDRVGGEDMEGLGVQSDKRKYVQFIILRLHPKDLVYSHLLDSKHDIDCPNVNGL